MARAVLFDLDNTLTPRRECVERFADFFAEAWCEALAPVTPEALRAALVEADHGGYNPRRAADLLRLLAWRVPPREDALEEQWQTAFPRASVVRAGAHELLSELRSAGTKLGCVTNGGVRGQNAKLDILGLTDYFDAIVISEGVGCKKPDPRIFEAAIERLGVAAPEAWFVGDHPLNDVLGASRFGMQAVWIRDGHEWPAEEKPPRHVIEALPELLEVLDDFNGGAGRGG